MIRINLLSSSTMSTRDKIITRTVSLHPSRPGKNRTYEYIKKAMLAFRKLENRYINVLMAALGDGRLQVSSFSGESKAHIKREIYNRLQLNEIYSSGESGLLLKERMRRCALQYPYFAVREWLVRRQYLSDILEVLIEVISESPRHCARFFHGGRLSYAVMKRISSALQTNCFGQYTPVQYFYIENLLGQVRNLFLNTSSLESVLSPRLDEISKDNALIERFIREILGSFTRKRKGKVKKIPPSELIAYFLTRYIAQVKRRSSWHAKHVKNHPNLDEFKNTRAKKFSPLEDALKAHINELSSGDLSDLATGVTRDVINEYLENGKHSITGLIFKPVLHRPRVGLTPSFDGFITYFTDILKNRMKEDLKKLFLTIPIVRTVQNKLVRLRKELPSLITTPRIRSLAIPINQEEGVYTPDFEASTITLSFTPRKYVELTVKDDKGRIKHILDKGASPCLPVITLKGHKLLLHLPLEISSSDLSKQSTTRPDTGNKRVEIGVDLGLKYPAVLSVMDRTDVENPQELARYFLGMTTLLDMTFDIRNGTFTPQKRFSQAHSCVKSNQKHKLRNIRREGRNLQRKLHEYENRWLEREGILPHNKYKSYRLQRDISRVWERVSRINRELVHQLQHVIIAIAAYHKASVIKFENLKWSRHSKKREKGGWLSFWQTHWFFSQVQEGIEYQSSLRGFEVRRIDARYTSQTCWQCHKRGSREGRSFLCKNTAHHVSGKEVRVHADLNAARVIALS